MKNRIKVLILAAALSVWALPATVYANVPDNVDTTVIDEEEEEEDHTPLTPPGNMTLVDDLVSSDNHSKQFMTVTTKNGNIFYIIVDRDNTTGTNNVHFLNQVDERDLMDLLSDEDKEALEEQVGGKIETPVQPAEPTPTETQPEEPKEKKGPNPILGVIIVLGLAGVAGFYFYSNSESFKRRKKGEDPDSAYADDYIDIPEEDEKEEE